VEEELNRNCVERDCIEGRDEVGFVLRGSVLRSVGRAWSHLEACLEDWNGETEVCNDLSIRSGRIRKRVAVRVNDIEPCPQTTTI
jgi:hypothetical protein